MCVRIRLRELILIVLVFGALAANVRAYMDHRRVYHGAWRAVYHLFVGPSH